LKLCESTYDTEEVSSFRRTRLIYRKGKEYFLELLLWYLPQLSARWHR